MEEEGFEEQPEVTLNPAEEEEEPENGPFFGYESSEEDFPVGVTRNTVGNIPMHWYDEYDHVGYDLSGKKLMKSARRDEIDEFLAKMDNPNYWRTLYDEVNDREVILTDAQLEILKRIQSGEAAEPEFDQYENLITYDNSDWFHPLSNKMKPKSSFQPSKWESQRVAYLVKAIKHGWIDLDKQPVRAPKVFQMWADDEVLQDLPRTKHERRHIPAPKMKLPGHAQSYRPPDEYLLTDDEKKVWEEQDPDERETPFIPQKFDALRHVGSYSESVRERFHRCLDLYMCPRQLKMKMNVDPEKLLPQLPKPKELRPFPTACSIEYEGHTDMIRSLDLSPDCQWLVTGSDDKTVRIWDVETGRCVVEWTFESVVYKVVWNPNANVSLVAVALDNGVVILSPPVCTEAQSEKTTNLFRDPSKRSHNWVVFAEGSKQWKQGRRMFYRTQSKVDTVSWHRKGDYLLSLSTKDTGAALLIHRLTTRKTQALFKKTKGDIQDAKFHTSKPWMILVTQRYVRIYDLTTQTLKKKMMGGVNWFSSVAVHPQGDHVVAGSFDRRVVWFDLDRGDKPFKVLRYHREGVRSVGFHPRLPLFASASHDGTIHVFHGRVSESLDEDPLIVPVKILRGHQIVEQTGVMDLVFHKTLPWVFSCGADGTAKLWTDV